MSTAHGKIWAEGIWENNPGLVQLLGLCPLLAVTHTVVNGIGLALATVIVLTLSNLLVSLVRGLLQPEIRIPAFVLISATLVTVVDLFLQAWLHDLSRALGIFVPLIVTNCTILARADAFASRQPVLPSVSDGLAQGAGFGMVLIGLGAARELLGQGSLLADVQVLAGGVAGGFRLQVLPADWEFVLAIVPPGAFFALGLMVAIRQFMVNRRQPRATFTDARQSA